jgi:hypothetical protein
MPKFRTSLFTLIALAALVALAAGGCMCNKTSDKEAEAAAAALGQALTEAMEKGDDEQPPSLERASDEKIAQLSMDFLDELAEVAVANKDDCDKIAANWNGIFKRKAKLMEKMSELDKRQTPAQKKAFNDKYGERSAAWMKKMEPVLTACAKNERLRQAMSNLKM